MGCVQSLFGPSKSRAPSPDAEFMPPSINTLPVTRQPKHKDEKSKVKDEDEDDEEEDEEEDDDDLISKCDDFDQYALKENDGNGNSVYYKNTTVDETGLVTILDTTSRCISANASAANRSEPPPLDSQLVEATARRLLIGSAKTAKTSATHPLTHQLSLQSRPTYTKTVDRPLDYQNDSMKLGMPFQWHGPPPPSPAPYTPKWPLKWPDIEQSSLDRIPVGVIEVLDSEPLDQRRWPSPKSKAQWFHKSQKSTRDKKIPPPVIHTVEMKPEILDHDNLFKIMTVQPRSTDQHYQSRPMAPRSNSTFESSSKKPFLRQSIQNKYNSNFTNDDYLDATGWMSKMPVFAKCPPAKSKSLPSRESIPLSIPTGGEEDNDRQHGVVRGASLPYDNGAAEKLSTSTKRDDDDIVVIEPISHESATIKTVIDKPVTIEKLEVKMESDSINKQNAIKELDVKISHDLLDTLHDVIDKSNELEVSTPEIKSDKKDELDKKNQLEDNDKPKNNDQRIIKSETEIENIPLVGHSHDGVVGLEKRENESGNVMTESVHTEDQEPELETEFRLTMIHSVREAVNRICEQAVERTAAIVKKRFSQKRNSNFTSSFKDRDVDHSEADDNASSEFSLPPPPPQHFSDTASTGQESFWPPPPTLSEAEEVRTKGPGFSFDLPDPPTEMDQMDSETDKLDISDEEMRATGLPSDDDDKTDTENGDGRVNHDRPGNEIGNIDAVMKSTASGGPPDGSMESTSVAVAQDNGADDRAATTIQAVYRGFRARKYVEAVNAAAVKIQAGFRGYRVRQSLKNASPSTATTTTDDSQCWSDDDQKSIVSVTYAPLKEYRCESRGAGDGDDGSVGGGHGPSAGDGGAGVVGGDGKDRGGDVGGVGAAVSGDVAVGGIDIYVDDDDDDDQLQTGDDEVFERDDVGPPSTNPTIVLSEPTNPDTPEDPAEAKALVQAAVKIQARVRGFAARKRLNEEKKDADDKQ